MTWSELEAWHREAVRIGRATGVPVTIFTEPPPPEFSRSDVSSVNIENPASDTLADARRRFATYG